MGPRAVDAEPLGKAVSSDQNDDTSLVTVGMALTEPSVQEFLEQPDLDLSIVDVYDERPEGVFGPNSKANTGWLVDSSIP